MTLAPGTRLGPYEIVSQLGAGGMGEVYRARDPKLDRDVALKVLPEAFTEDPERLARFKREAKLLASLNHPNIAAIYGFEDSGETHALVLELVEGPTLAHRIATGTIPLDDALPIARQIAEALEAAHEQGIIHRDLKPANIKVTPDGVVKVLDFGLARALDAPGRSGESGGSGGNDAANSPTMTMTAAATQMGMLLGTAAYMSPEQAKGRPVDRRTDAWSFGVVLHEMLTGRQAFAASDVSETLAFVLTREIDLSGLPDDTPSPIRRLLRRCLVRDPRNRLADLSMARIEIDEALSAPDDRADVGATPVSATSAALAGAGVSWPVAAGLALLAVIATALAMWFSMGAAPEPADVIRLSVDSAAGLPSQGNMNDVAISRDGRTLVFSVRERENVALARRALDGLEPVTLQGTLYGDGPFLSPDGQSVGFSRGAEIRRVSVLGGASRVIVNSGFTIRGASWGADDQIVFGSPNAGLFRVPAAGGEAEALTRPPEGEWHRWPHVLPGDRAVLFSRTAPGPNVMVSRYELAVLSIETGEVTSLGVAGSFPRYSSTGHVVYARDDFDAGGTVGSLYAVPFDLERLEIAGPPTPMVENVVMKPAGAANFDLSSGGRLVYMHRQGQGQAARGLVWVDRSGQEEPLDASPGQYFTPAISPDGARVAVDRADGGSPDIWILDLTRRTETKLTADAFTEANPLWSPDGTRVVFGSVGQEDSGLFWKAADGSGETERLMSSLAGTAALGPTGWSADGQTLAYWIVNASTDIGLASADGSDASLLLDSGFQEQVPAVSPDGGWIAYESDESGRLEVYVERFPELGQRTIVSRGGGRQPVWSRDGTELFYRAPAGVTAVPVEAGQRFSAGEPEVLFEDDYFFFLSRRTYDVSPDGQRFLMVTQGDGTETGAPLRLIVVENWHQELLEQVPVP